MSRADDGLRRILREHLRDIMWTTIETGTVSPGVADANYLASGGIEGWVECKRTDGWAVKFRPGQVPWLDRRARLGGRVWIAVRRRRESGPRRGAAADELWLVPGSAAVQLSRDGLGALARGGPQSALVWPGGPARWDWAAARAALLGPPR